MEDDTAKDNSSVASSDKSAGDDIDVQSCEGILIQAYELDNSNADFFDKISMPTASFFKKASENRSMLSSPIKYKAGDHVRATYYVDGIDYEATVVSIDLDKRTCIVHFIGYENEEEVKIDNLVASWGKKARRQQIANAKSAEEQPTTANSNMNSNSPFRKAGVPGCPTVLPPPPIPPDFGQLLGKENVKLMSAMLVSWYMTGYYTGVYQGKMMADRLSTSKPTAPKTKTNSNCNKKS